MPALNRVQLIGRLGRDPEVRFTSTGREVTNFSLAVDHRWRGNDGELKEATDWFQIVAWGRLGEICSQYLGKGRLVYLEGRLQTQRYEQQGETRYFTRVITQSIQFLDSEIPAQEEEAPEEPGDDVD